MRAVVLVGGEGTRLRPLTYTTPKQMLPIAGTPMIERVLGQLADHGVDDVVLSMGYRPDAFSKAFPDGTCGGVKLTYAVEPEPLDTAGAIGFAARYASVDDTFVVVNGDVLTDLDVSALVALHREKGAQATISLTPVEDPSAFGVVPTDAEGRVEAFIEKPPRESAPTNLINAGTYVMEPSVIDLIPEGRRVSVERETFPLIVETKGLFAMPSDGYWLDTGTPDKYLQANLDYLDGLRRQQFSGNRYISADARVDESATVRRSIIDSSVRIEGGAEVVDSVILPGAVVGAGAKVIRSIVGEGAKVLSDASLEDLSVVGGGQEVAAGSRHAGARIGMTPDA